MGYYHENEKPPEFWIHLIDRLNYSNNKLFIIVYGGEPLLYEGLSRIVKHLNEKGIGYTIISNQTQKIFQRILKLYEEVGALGGVTGSIDPIIANTQSVDSDRLMKSKLGLEHLYNLKLNNITSDVVAELTITPDDIPFVRDTVGILSGLGIYTSITAVDDSKSEYYDFSNVDKSYLVQPTSEIKSLFNDLKDESRYLIHIPELLNDLFNALPSRMRCDIYKNIHNVTIDADGSLRLCLRIRGVKTPSKKFIESLPYGKIPDRNDFYLFKGRDKERISYWLEAVEMSRALGDEFLEIVESGKIRGVELPVKESVIVSRASFNNHFLSASVKPSDCSFFLGNTIAP